MHTMRQLCPWQSASRWLLAVGVVVVVATMACHPMASPLDEADEYGDNIESMSGTGADGVQRTELAFRAPQSGFPEAVVQLYCANIKLRLYWGQFRTTSQGPYNKAVSLRRMGRLARHIFEDIRDVDKPFNETQISIMDEFFKPPSPEELNSPDEASQSTSSSHKEPRSGLKVKFSAFKRKLHGLGKHDKHDKGHDEHDSDDTLIAELQHQSAAERQDSQSENLPDQQLDPKVEQQLELETAASALKLTKTAEVANRVKAFVKKWAPKVALGIYTRYRGMWWLMLGCLYTKYYLWDPALDEFIKLKRALVMYPDFQLLKLQELDCKPTKFFKHLIDVCKMLNPLLIISLGQLNLDRMTRFNKGLSLF